MKPKFIEYYMDIAILTSKLSYAKRLQVGAVIVKNNQVIGTGYNGMPSGWDNNCENIELIDLSDEQLDPKELLQLYPFEGKFWINYVEVDTRYRLKTKQEVLHAESNAIAKVSRSTESSENATLFCTHAPCIECAKLIYQSGISNIYYRDAYRDNTGLDFLRKSGVNVTNHKPQG